MNASQSDSLENCFLKNHVGENHPKIGENHPSELKK
jgi:hypothetical protein